MSSGKHSTRTQPGLGVGGALHLLLNRQGCLLITMPQVSQEKEKVRLLQEKASLGSDNFITCLLLSDGMRSL